MPYDTAAAWLAQQSPGRGPAAEPDYRDPNQPFSYDPVTNEPLYLPEGWGGPSAEDFARAGQRREQNRDPLAAVRGTSVDPNQSPAAAWLASQPPQETPAIARSKRFGDTVKGIARHIFEPPDFVREWARKNIEALQPAYERGNRVAAFLQGAHQGATELLNPFDITTAALGFGPEARGASAAARFLRGARTASEGAQALLAAGKGVPEVVEGVQERDPLKIGQGVFETAMGGVMGTQVVGRELSAARRAAERAAELEGRAAHEARMEQARVDTGRDYRSFNRLRNDPAEWLRMNREAGDLARGMAATPPEDVAPAARALPPPALEEGPGTVEDWLRGVQAEPRPPLDVQEGEIAQRAIQGAPAAPQLESRAARFLADNTGVRDLATTPDAARALPEGRGEPIVPPPPPEPFRGTYTQASFEPQGLTDGELRMAYIDAATANDAPALARLDAELQARKAAGVAPAAPPSPEAPTSLATLLSPEPAAPTAEAAPGAMVGASPDNIAQAAKTGDVVAFTPETVGQLALDPKTYQFKTADARGRTAALEGVKSWDPWSPPILVHRTPEGRLFVADGHQRFNKYLELAQQGVELPPLRARIVEGPTASVMRAASLRNVQEGSADPLDIARLVRNGGQLTEAERARIGNLSSTKLRQGQDLAQLGDDAFNQVLAGVAPPEYAAFVGRHIQDPLQQALVVNQLGAAGLDNAVQAEAFVKAMRDAGFETAEQTDLFGNSIQAVSLAKPKAQIVDSVLKGLREQRRAFAGALAHQRRLEAAGNVLAGTENARLADEAGKLKAYFEALYDKPGTATHAAIRTAAAAVHNRQLTPSGASQAVIDALRADLEGGQFGATAAAVGRSAGAPTHGPVARGPVSEPPGSLPLEAGGQPDVTPPAEAQPPLPATPPKKARTLLEEALGKDRNKTLIREVMDSIVAVHPKDAAAQATAAREWLDSHPDAVRMARTPEAAPPKAESPWEPRPGGGEHRLVESPAGTYHEVRFAERPPIEDREALSAQGYKYDFRDKTWRRQGGPPPPPAPPAASSPQPPATASGPAAVAPKPRQRLPRGVPRGTRLPRLSKAEVPEGTHPKLTEYLESGDPAAGKTLVDEIGKKYKGTNLASDFAGLSELFEKNPGLAWMVTRIVVGAVVGSRTDERDPLLGALIGAGVGAAANRRTLRALKQLTLRTIANSRSTPWTAAKTVAEEALGKGKMPPLRAPAPKAGEDFSILDYLRRPEGVVPEHFERLSRGYQSIEDFLAGEALPGGRRDLHGNLIDDPYANLRGVNPKAPEARTKASGVYYEEALRELRRDIKDSTEKGLHRRANYLRMLERAVTEEPVHAHKFFGDLLGVNARKIQRLDNTVTNHIYRILLGGAVDSAIQNRTQVGFNLKNVPLRYVLEGIRQGHTPEGMRATEFAKLHRPLDAEIDLAHGKPLSKLDEWLNTMESSDTQNRRESYLAARQYALDQGASAAEADRWAKASMRQTQGEPGPAGKHPWLRELGPLRTFKNYPHMVAELLADTIALRKVNPAGFRRMAAYFLLAGGGGTMAGVNMWNVLFPRFSLDWGMLTSGPDLLHHATGAFHITDSPDHRISEDLLGAGNKPGLLTPRWPRKAVQTVRSLITGYGRDEKTGELVRRNAKGQETSRQSPLAAVGELLGVQTSSRASDIEKTNRAFKWLNAQKAASSFKRRDVQRALADAIDRGDQEAARELLRGLPKRTRRELRRAVGQTKWQRLRRQVPRAQRREFDMMFGGQ